MSDRVSTGQDAKQSVVDANTTPNGKLYAVLSESEIVDRWYCHDDRTLSSVKAFSVDGITASALGIYVFRIYRLTEADGGFNEEILEERDINVGGKPLLDQIITEMVTQSGGYEYSEGQICMIGIESDNADLTGGNGIFVAPRFKLRGKG